MREEPSDVKDTQPVRSAGIKTVTDEGDFIMKARKLEQFLLYTGTQPTISYHINDYYYVAAKATYIRLLHGKIGFLGFFSALAP